MSDTDRPPDDRDAAAEALRAAGGRLQVAQLAPGVATDRGARERGRRGDRCGFCSGMTRSNSPPARVAGLLGAGMDGEFSTRRWSRTGRAGSLGDVEIRRRWLVPVGVAVIAVMVA